jgi:hypothetical protein
MREARGQMEGSKETGGRGGGRWRREREVAGGDEGKLFLQKKY